MAGISALRRLFGAVQTNLATVVNAPTFVLPLEADVSKTRELTEVRGHQATLAESTKRVVTGQGTDISLTGVADFGTLVHLLPLVGRPDASPSQIPNSGTARGRTYDFTPSGAAQNTRPFLKIFYGDDVAEHQYKGVYMEELSLEFSLNEAVTLNATMKGQGGTEHAARVASPARGTLNPLITNKTTTIEISTDGGTTWTTLNNKILNATLRMPTGIVPQDYLDGGLDFNAVQEGVRTWELEAEMQHDANAATQLDRWANLDVFQIRITNTGTTISGQIAERFQCAFNAQWADDSLGVFAENNALSTLTLTARSIGVASNTHQFSDITSLTLQAKI